MNPETFPAPADKFTEDGMTFRRRGKKYVTRIKYRGKVHVITLAETKADSIRGAKLARKEIHSDRWTQFKTSTQLRSPHPKTPLTTIYTAYRAFPGNVNTATKAKNIQALDRILAKTKPEQQTWHLEDLTGDLLWNWKQAILKDSNAADEERGIQLRRSANSTLRQARSIFSREACEYYTRETKLHLPAALEKFRNETGFKKVEKTDYHAPADSIIKATIEALDAITGVGPHGPVPVRDIPENSLNEYKACWLAIGFGLRAGEIAKCKNADFKRIAGDIYFQPDWRAKNKKIPEIGVQLDAWTRLGRLIENQPAEAYVLTGHTTERTADVFRRISDRFKQFGWQTTHHAHELRAWAGCQLADKHPQGLLAAQAFMRHSTYSTTQKYYGHHIKVRLEKVQLTIPTIAPFEPTLLPAATA